MNISDYTETIMLEIQSTIKNRMYKVRPQFTMNMAPGFTMPRNERVKFSDLTVLVSLPMYASHA